jgi:hypothetical protein
MTSTNRDVEEFAQRLVEFVRDQSVEASDRLLRGKTMGPLGDRWRAAAEDETARDAVNLLIPDVVDQVLFHLLDAIDNDHLPLLWPGSEGAAIGLSSAGLGEMAGWYTMGRGGWIERFSRQRYFDALADLP